MDDLDRECLAELPEYLAVIPVEERGNTAEILKEIRRQKLLAKALLPAIKQILAEKVEPLQVRIAELEKAASGPARRARRGAAREA